MTNPNQQLLDYAVENIKEWHPHHTCLRSDRSAYPLFYTGQYDGWDLHDNQWFDGGNFAKLEGTLGKTTPQVITKDEWLAEIKRREEGKPMVLERDNMSNITNNTKPFRGRIENWKVDSLYALSSGEQCIIGKIFGDEDKFEDGTFIRTSAIIQLDYEDKKLETINSIYELGKEYSV